MKSFTSKKPFDWPTNVPWTKNTKIVTVIETIPPYYVLANGAKVKANYIPKKKFSTKKSASKRRKTNKSKRNKSKRKKTF